MAHKFTAVPSSHGGIATVFTLGFWQKFVLLPGPF